MSLKLEALSHAHRTALDNEISFHKHAIAQSEYQMDFWYRFDELLRDKELMHEFSSITYREFFIRLANTCPHILTEREDWAYKGHAKDVIQRYLMEPK